MLRATSPSSNAVAIRTRNYRAKKLAEDPEGFRAQRAAAERARRERAREQDKAGWLDKRRETQRAYRARLRDRREAGNPPRKTVAERKAENPEQFRLEQAAADRASRQRLKEWRAAETFAPPKSVLERCDLQNRKYGSGWRLRWLNLPFSFGKDAPASAANVFCQQHALQANARGRRRQV